MTRRAAGSIGGLVFLIAIFIILYVLVMPPCEKCQLIKQEDCSDVCDESQLKGVLLFDDVGEVSVRDQVVHELAPVNLYIRVDDAVETLAGSLFVNRGWFGNVDQDLEFNLEDLNNLDNVYLTFRVADSRGKLYIELNDHIIFSEEVDAPATKVLSLPDSYLEETNELKLYVDSPGLAFWAKNHYDLKNLEIRQEFETVHYEENREFSLSSNEKGHIQDSTLKFSVFCTSAQGLTILKTFLNDKMLSSESILCQSFTKEIPLDRTDLEVGTNEVTFVIDNGNFLLSPVEIINNLDADIYPSYNFEVEDSVYDFADEYYLSLRMDSGDKEARIMINNYNINLDTSNTYYEKDITKYVKKGNNYIEIVPVGEFDINEIKVWYE